MCHKKGSAQSQNRSQSAVFAAFIGIDRSDHRLDVCLQEAGAVRSEPHTLTNTPEALQAWLHALEQRFGGQPVALAFEQPASALMHQLLNCPFLVLYPLNPMTLARYRQAFNTSRVKDDTRDARCLMELVRDHRDKLQAFEPEDEVTRALRYLVEARRQAVDLRTQLTNRLKAHLKGYYPQVLELISEDLHTALCCDFLLRWPSLQELKRARAQTVRRFYIDHSSRRHDVIERRLQLIQQSVPVTGDAALLRSATLTTQLLCGQLQHLRASITAFDGEIAQLFEQHEDGFIFASLPGAGSVHSARLLAAFGSDRSRFASAQEMENYSGIAPVIKQSGNTRLVQRRRACPHFLHQSFVEYADQSIRHCAWAKAFYRMQRDRGKGHWAAVRALAFKWIRILFRCWQERVAYEEEKYLEGLRLKRSPLCAVLQEPQKA